MLQRFKKFIPPLVIDFSHRLWPVLGNIIYHQPSAQLKVIGVTGTNGKTTVVHLLSEILTEAGFKVASCSSLRFKINQKEWPNLLKMTMPGRLKLQRFLKKAVKAGCKIAVIEVTSEGIKQHRHEKINFYGAVLTNITKEHIEAHGGFAAYKAAKAKLFEKVMREGQKGSFIVINWDDPESRQFLKFKADQNFVYSLKELSRAEKKKLEPFKVVKAKIVKTKGPIQLRYLNKLLKSNLYGQFNAANILAALAAALALGVKISFVKEALEKFEGVPGRLETVITKPFRVVVDYAHTPDALEKVYQTLFPTARRLICVLGSAGGGRDRWKRPELGKLAASYCQKVIVTNEDPYDEDPWQIINEVAVSAKAEKILDRKEAIKRALSLARPGDTVVITGKGAESWLMMAGGKKIPWDDRQKVKEAWQELKQN